MGVQSMHDTNHDMNKCKLIIFREEVVWNYTKNIWNFKLQLHDAIYRLRFYLNSLIHILLLSKSHNNVASLQKNRGDKSHPVIRALFDSFFLMGPLLNTWQPQISGQQNSQDSLVNS